MQHGRSLGCPCSTGRGQRRVFEVQPRAEGDGVGGGAEAADRGEVEFEQALVAREAHLHALAFVGLDSGGPRHLALLAVYDLVA